MRSAYRSKVSNIQMSTVIPVRILILLCVTCLGLALISGSQSVGKSAQSYRRLNASFGHGALSDEVEVIEFFSYGCPHCAKLEPMLETWRIRNTQHIRFKRVPVSLSSDAKQVYSRLFYVLDSLGVAEKLSAAVFNEIHVYGHYLQTEQEQAAFLEKSGVPSHDVQRAFGESTRLDRRMIEDAALQDRYHIHSVPQFVVQDEFSTDPELAEGLDACLAVLDNLVRAIKSRSKDKIQCG